MYCFFCNMDDIKVIDLCLVVEGNQVCCRRECLVCNECFIIYESVELMLFKVVKFDGICELFDENKLCSGIYWVLEKCLVSVEEVELVINKICYKLWVIGEWELLLWRIGEDVMNVLCDLDQVVYV